MSGTTLVEKIHQFAAQAGDTDRVLAQGTVTALQAATAAKTAADANVSNVSVSGTTMTVTKGTGEGATSETYSVGATYNEATTSTSGLMSATDKAKLDGIGAMTGATSGAAGTAGLVPAPAAGDEDKFLRGDGTYATPPDSDTTYSVATPTTDGLMSAEDKAKLDGIEDGATAGGGMTAILVSTVAISGDSAIPIGYSKTYTLSATCLLTSAEVDHFAVTFNGTTQNVAASNGSASVTLTMPAGTADGTEMEISAVAYDNYGNSGQASTKTVTAQAASVAQPTVTAANATMYPNAAQTLTGSAFAATGITGNHTKTDWKVLTSNDVENGTAEWSSLNDATNKTSISVPANSLTAGTRYVTCRYYDATLGWSDWATPVAFTVNPAYVNAPNTVTPTSGSQIIKSNGLTVTVNAMSCTGGSDTQASLTVDICSDSAGNNVLATKTVTGTGTSVSFTSSELSSLATNTNYYIRARRTGTNLGESAKSSPISIQFINGTNVRGCLVYRSANGIATTVEAVGPDGTTPLKFEVIDAAYRKDSLKFGAYNKDNPDLQFFADKGSNSGWYIDGGTANISQTADLPAGINMSSLVSKWGGTLTGLETAHTACNSWKTRYQGTTDTQSITGVPAVEYCMGLTNDGGGWLLPNIWELMIIYMLSDTFDEMDPTASANPTLKLGKTATSGRFSFGTSYAWSCTEYSATHCRTVNYNGHVRNGTRTGAACAVPVRELS